jgi:hypothetical protein
MTKEEYLALTEVLQPTIEEIRERAYMLHESVNQRYDGVHPYGYHLDMVADSVRKYGHLVCVSEFDILPLFFGAYYHDSIEDARMTYNDVKKGARLFMNNEQTAMATEIVYALTNDKGRSRTERAGDHYYQGIRETPYAPFLKLSDRLANITYSFTHTNKTNEHMRNVYIDELPHFLEAINAHSDDPRFGLPEEMINDIIKLL